MSAQSMSDELMKLEAQLRSRSVDEPPADLRQRVLNAVAVTTAQSPAPVISGSQWDIHHWAAVAAVVFVVLNLSMISASQGEFSSGPAVTTNQITTELQALRRVETQQEGPFK
jgi:hypothetical protein